MRASLSRTFLGRLVGGDRGRGREPAGIVAGGDRPGVLVGVVLSVDADVLGPQAEPVGDDLRQHRRVTLALGESNRR